MVWTSQYEHPNWPPVGIDPCLRSMAWTSQHEHPNWPAPGIHVQWRILGVEFDVFFGYLLVFRQRLWFLPSATRCSKSINLGARVHFFYSSTFNVCFPLKNWQLVIAGSDTTCTITMNTKLLVDLMCLYNMGLRRYAVTYMGRMGCLDVVTVESSYASCNATSNNSIFLYYIFLFVILGFCCSKYAY